MPPAARNPFEKGFLDFPKLLIMTAIIKTENLGKKYVLRHQQAAGYQTLRESIYSGLNNFKAKLLGKSPTFQSKEEFWALKDASFEVEPGEKLGIIGRNGAGKSTLLKLLSRITIPSEGKISLNGRVASLLEVGTGFHPELTGRENIFLNGSVMGMKRAEIKKKFDEITAFAEVEKFLDTPVKRFSSGMYVRLAFSVAAHLEPEILLVDEVLAVGDAEFQKKCLGKMGDIANKGRTVLFVSHNMGAIKRLCNRSIVIDNGRIILDDNSDTAVDTYLSRFLQAEPGAGFKSKLPGETRNGFLDIYFMNEIGGTDTVLSGAPLEIHLKYKVEEQNRLFDWGIGVYDEIGNALFHFGSLYSRKEKTPLPKEGNIICKIPRLPLPEGRYRFNFSMHKDGHYLEHLVGAAYLYVEKGDFFGTGNIPTSSTAKVLLDHWWEIKEEHHGNA